MVNEKIEVKLPDGTKLIAETERNIDYPAINISHMDAERNVEVVAFAEYNQMKPFGQKVCVGTYQNQDEDTKYYDIVCYCIKPTFTELSQLYKECPDEIYHYQYHNGYVELRCASDGMFVYRDFCYDNKPNHIGHDIRLSEYAYNGEPQNYSFKCFDCNEVIYSVDKPNFPVLADEVEYEIEDITKSESYKNPRITYLDDVEDECWNLFKTYASYVGVKFGNGIDYEITKELSEKIIVMVEQTFGIPFPISKNR